MQTQHYHDSNAAEQCRCPLGHAGIHPLPRAAQPTVVAPGWIEYRSASGVPHQFPVVTARMSGPTWYVQCPHCGLRHAHGAGEGMRLGHCSSSSPQRGSYYVRAPGAWWPYLSWGETGPEYPFGRPPARRRRR